MIKHNNIVVRNNSIQITPINLIQITSFKYKNSHYYSDNTEYIIKNIETIICIISKKI